MLKLNQEIYSKLVEEFKAMKSTKGGACYFSDTIRTDFEIDNTKYFMALHLACILSEKDIVCVWWEVKILNDKGEEIISDFDYELFRLKFLEK